ncbi:MAG: glycosyltransferase [Planctomycetaceae bacterium]|jgi:glycosyltransferase involved in cell wall biosynthesis|nr:glycosyltransferase [Planctomycetaceae bacterium]
MPKLSILIPVYNEQAYLERLVERVVAAWLPEGLEKEIIIVNDASKDRTPEIILKLCERYPIIRAFEQPTNQGKGAAIRRAIEEMTGDFAIIQDADLEYNPNEYHLVLKPLLDGYADVVYGSRFASREMRKVLFYHHKIGNNLLTFLSNLVTGLDLTDMETCYKAFRGHVLKSIPLRSNRFGIEPEITVKIAKRGLNVYEVPISYHGRKYSEGKKIGWKDGISAVWTILKYWFLDDYAKESDVLQVKNSPDSLRRYYHNIVRCSLPYLGNKILELESHVGLVSRLLPQREKLVVSDHREECVRFLKNLFDGNAVVSVIYFDPDSNFNTDSDIDSDKAVPNNEFDSVLYIHGLQKTENDLAVLKQIYKILRPGGKAILVVPQYPSLFCELDKTLDYRRRYTKQKVNQLCQETGFRIVKCRSVHTAAYFSWLFNGVLLHHAKIGKVQLKILNMLTPFSGLLSLLLPGGNLFVVAEKPENSE